MLHHVVDVSLPGFGLISTAFIVVNIIIIIILKPDTLRMDPVVHARHLNLILKRPSGSGG
jgi:hypothetical protein